MRPWIEVHSFGNNPREVLSDFLGACALTEEADNLPEVPVVLAGGLWSVANADGVPPVHRQRAQLAFAHVVPPLPPRFPRLDVHRQECDTYAASDTAPARVGAVRLSA